MVGEPGIRSQRPLTVLMTTSSPRVISRLRGGLARSVVSLVRLPGFVIKNATTQHRYTAKLEMWVGAWDYYAKLMDAPRSELIRGQREGLIGRDPGEGCFPYSSPHIPN